MIAATKIGLGTVRCVRTMDVAFAQDVYPRDAFCNVFVTQPLCKFAARETEFGQPGSDENSQWPDRISYEKPSSAALIRLGYAVPDFASCALAKMRRKRQLHRSRGFGHVRKSPHNLDYALDSQPTARITENFVLQLLGSLSGLVGTVQRALVYPRRRRKRSAR